MDGTLPLTALSSALSASVNIAEKAFEIHAVSEQAQSLLKTVDHVANDLREARSLRRQKSSLFTTGEKRMFDETFRRTEEAVSQVAALTEPVRVDLEVSGGHVRLQTRMMFVLRDSPRIHVCLTQLGIVSQSLNRDMGTLCSRERRNDSSPLYGGISQLPPPPPTYDEAMFISEQRQKNMRRRASAMSIAHSRNSSVAPPTPRTVSAPEIAPDPPTVVCEEAPMLHDQSSQVSLIDSIRPSTNPSTSSLASSSVESLLRPVQRAGSGRQRGLRWLEIQSG